jgi:hypothetical protein
MAGAPAGQFQNYFSPDAAGGSGDHGCFSFDFHVGLELGKFFNPAERLNDIVTLSAPTTIVNINILQMQQGDFILTSVSDVILSYEQGQCNTE